MRTKKNRVIGFDIGGTKMRAVVWNGRRVVARHERRTPKNARAFTKTLRTITRLFLRRYPDISRVGVGVAGVLDGFTVRASPNIPHLSGTDFRRQFPDTVTLRVDNDARTFARAEYALGAGKKSKNLLAVTLGTGVGRAVVSSGRVRGLKKFEYPEAWEREYQRLQSKSAASVSVYLAHRLAPIVRRFKPDTIVLGGGAIESGRRLFLYLKRELARLGVRCKVKRSVLRRDAAAVGAALLARH